MNSDTPSGLSPSLARNIELLDKRRLEEEAGIGHQEQVARHITNFVGSMVFVYVHIALYAAWIAVNLGWVPGITPFDRGFDMLGTQASVEAIFIATFVLINQNRTSRIAEKRAGLALHIGLLTEDELTKLTDVVTAIAAKLNVEIAGDHGIHEVKQVVAPDAVLDELEARQDGD